MKISCLIIRGFVVLTMMLVLGSPAALYADAEKAGDVSGIAQYESLENNPGAIVKTGFFVGISKGRVTYMDMNTHRKYSYRLEEGYRVLYQEEIVPLTTIVPHSIVKLVMIEGQVLEIILVQRSS